MCSSDLASAISPTGDEAECLALAEEALAIGREIGDRFTIAVAQMYAANSLRRMFHLDEASPRMEEAIRIFRDLGARWELASAVGDRATIHRLAGRLPEAVSDLAEALKLSRELGDRAVLSWTMAEAARTRVAMGDLPAARQALEESSPLADPAHESIRAARVLIELASGEREAAQAGALGLLEKERAEGHGNAVAARVWWVGSLFGPDAAGGPGEVEKARKALEAAHWIQFLREPELALERLTSSPWTST